jgi:radical SAM superfamily enzyme YgiQ (UPF0313 family)
VEGDPWWSGAASYADEYLRAGADVVVDGEAELTLEELLPALRSGTVDRVPGVILSRARTDLLLELPSALVDSGFGRPALAGPAAGRHRTIPESSGGSITARDLVSVITARGCPYHCTWCSHSTFGKNAPAAIGARGGR